MDFKSREDCQRWVSQFMQEFPEATGKLVTEGYHAKIMFAPRLASKGEKDQVHGLPPGVTAPAYPVHKYAGCPSEWSKKGDAYFIPVPMSDEGQGPGMWYEWRGNDREFFAAIVPSTTGMNPITGQKVDKLRLEHYREKCPIHKVDFEGERFCPECNFKWPPQNYVSDPNILWWDGFRVGDQVRQFYFTAEMLKKDVGIAVLGGDRVPSFGFAFFRSKEPKPVRQMHRMRGSVKVCSLFGIEKGGDSYGEQYLGGPPLRRFGLKGGSRGGMRSLMGSKKQSKSVTASVRRTRSAAHMDQVGVAAGARVRQELELDKRSLDEWEERPAAVIVCHFVSEGIAREILNGPKRDTEGDREGFLAGVRVPVGVD